VRLTNDGLSLWYGTPDAPAPGDDGIVPRRGASLVVGVHPANPTNAVRVQLRVDGGITQTAPGRELRTDHDRQSQYYMVAFPAFPSGDLVEYSVIASCGGRQVPPPHIASRFPSKFRLPTKETPAPKTLSARQSSRSPKPKGPRFGANLSFLGSVAVDFQPPQYIGDTAEGMRINFFAREGSVMGDGIKGKILDGACDHLLVRPDGIGLVRVQGAFAMDGGGLLDVEWSGYVDLGADGYGRARAHNLPDESPIVVRAFISTRYPKYRWLSRIQCVGVGQTHLDALQARYRLYAAAPRRLS
jgi:hypothetical protein